MKVAYFFLLFLLPILAIGQTTSSSIVEVITTNNEKVIADQKNKEIQWKGIPFLPGVSSTTLSPWLVGLSLDNSAMKSGSLKGENQCQNELKEKEQIEFSAENLPAELKENGWHVLFEVQFAPTVNEDTKNPGEDSIGFPEWEVNFTKEKLKAHNLSGLDIPDKISDLDAWSRSTFGFGTNHDISREGALIFSKIATSYSISHEEGIKTLKNYSHQMSDQEYVNFLSRIAAWAPYNDDRANFKQTDDAGKGAVSTKDLLSGTKFGVCGDIHSMVARMAEVRGWEAVTLGYALPGGQQHVITAVINPAHPDQINLINYNHITVKNINDPNHNPLSSSDEMHEMGIGIRIFKNKLGNGLEGDMVEIGHIPTALGNFFRDLVVKDYENKEKAFNGDESFRQNKITFEETKEKTIIKNGDTQNKKIQDGISIFEGAVDGAHIWGLAVSHDVFKEIKKPDGDLRRLGYRGISLASSLVEMNRNATADKPLQALYVYLNMRGGRIYTLKETQFVKLQGLLGYELTGFAAVNSQSGKFETGDGNFETFAQLMGEYNKKGTNIKFAAKLDMAAGLRNQNVMTDLKQDFTGNINPLMVNALSLEGHLQQNLDSRMSLTADAKYSLARFGNRVTLSTGIIVGNSQFTAGYAGGLTNVRLPGTNTKTNFMINQGTTPDGLYVGYDGQYKFKTMQGTFGIMSGYNPINNMPFVNAKATIKLNQSKKKRKPAFRQ
ncbi:MAG: hypothetical protein ACOYL6_07125 [Bacteriovoracaceae bacterium]